MRYQIRIIGDKKISLKYFYTNKNYTDDETIVILNENEYYFNELEEQLKKICLKQKDDLDNIFFNLQIVKVDNQQNSTLINQPLFFNIVYRETLKTNEIRFYTQGTFDFLDEDLKYIFNLKRKKGKILVYFDQCLDYPNCFYSKEILEQKEKESTIESTFKKLFNIDEIFIHSKKLDLILDIQKPFVYIIQCLSENCSYEFWLQKSDEIKNLNQIKKYSGSIKQTQIDKFSVQIKNDQIISKIIIILFTHSGEVMLNTNNNCNLINIILLVTLKN